MGQCSICKNPEVSQTVNELLYAKQGLDEIAQATGCHRSSVFRHQVNPRCYLTWKAARLKAKSNRVDTSSGRLLVLWPAGHSANGPHDGRETCTLDGQPFDLSTRQRNDVLLRVQFEQIGRVKNLQSQKGFELSL